MGHRPGYRALVWRTLHALLFAALLCAFIFRTNLQAQQPRLGGAPSGPGLPQDLLVTVVVSVREISGLPIQGSAFVKLNSDFSGVHLTAPTMDASSATFPSVRAGEYEIEVNSEGYKTASEHASIMPNLSSYNVYVYMSKIGEPDTAGGPKKSQMNPRVQSEMDKGLDKMRHQQFDVARAHFEKAAKIAPTNADVQYLLGMLEYYQQHYDLAETKLKTAVSMDPSHERALATLGEIELRNDQPTVAAKTLEQAYQVNGADWHVHYLLAFAYGQQKEYDKAVQHAQKAAELGGKTHAAQARVLLAKLLVSQSKISEATAAFNDIVRDFPDDPAAKEAKAALAAIHKTEATAAAVSATSSTVGPSGLSAAEPAPQPVPATPAVVRPWAPEDVDSKEYVVAPDVSCSETDVLQRTEARTTKQMGNFEKFLATEHIEHQEIDAYGDPGPVKARDFTYLVFISRPKKGGLYLEEERDGGENLQSFPTSLASRGLVGLGVFLFSPEYEDDFNYKCQGLSEWRGQAAWQLRFEQKKDVSSRVMTWRNNRGVFPVPLKGRVWVAANSYDVLHIETDLREPVPQLELDRDHLIIDYGPVKFEHGKTSLWLPWYAELYMQVHGRRYHHRHTLTNYSLFSVDTDHQISAPKEAPKGN